MGKSTGPATPPLPRLNVSLHKLSEFGNEEQLKALLNSPDCDVNAKDEYGCTALHYACKSGQTAVVRQLLQRGAKLNASNLGGLTPLHNAIINDHIELSMLLMKEFNASVQLRDKAGNNALHLAASVGSDLLCNYLLHERKVGTYIHRETKSSSHLGHPHSLRGSERHGSGVCSGSSSSDEESVAGRHSDQEGASSSGCESSRTDSEGEEEDHTEIAVDVNQRNFHGCTALHRATNRGNAKIVALLLKARADVFIHDNDGNTALHYAARGCFPGLCRKLLDKDEGQKLLSAHNLYFQSAKDVAGSDEVIDLLMQYEEEQS